MSILLLYSDLNTGSVYGPPPVVSLCPEILHENLVFNLKIYSDFMRQ